MNASALLHNQGWRGEGFSLDHSDRGLAKPLLVSRKSDLAGLGTKKNDFGNQWWTDAFDRTLRDFGSGKKVVQMAPTVQSPALGKQDGGLYGNFVKAGTLKSTMKDEGRKEGTETGKKSKKTKPAEINTEDIEASFDGGVPLLAESSLPPSKAEKKSKSKENNVDKENKKKKKLQAEGEQKLQQPEGDDVKEKKKKKKSMTKIEPENGGFSTDHDAQTFGVLGLPPSQTLQTSQPPKFKVKEQTTENKKRKPSHEEDHSTSKKKQKKPNDATKADHDGLPAVGGASSFGVLGLPLSRPLETPTLNIKEAKGANKKRKLLGEDHDSDKKKKMQKRVEMQATPEPFFPSTVEKPAKVEADFIKINEPTFQKPNAKNKEKYNKNPFKNIPKKEIRKQRKAQKAIKAQENANRNKEAKKLTGPPHPDSITGLREKGEQVHLPGDEGDENDLRSQLIRCYEGGKKEEAKKLLKNAKFPHEGSAGVKNAGKFERRKRRSEGRVAKHWVSVRASPHLYRPDGTRVPNPLQLDPSLPEEEAVAQLAEKKARKELRRQRKVDMRATKKNKAGGADGKAVAKVEAVAH